MRARFRRGIVGFGCVAAGVSAPARTAWCEPTGLETERVPEVLIEPRREAADAPEPPTLNWVVPVVHTAALFTGMRLTEAVLWPEPFAETRPRIWLQHYEEAFTRPPLFDPQERAFEWDGDHWTINAVGHGLLGSELYYRPRRCGASPWAAFAFAAGASAVWEYGFEANGVRPSALDLVYTPLSGWVLGEARLLGFRGAAGIGDRTLRGIVRAVLDPFGELERAAGAPC